MTIFSVLWSDRSVPRVARKRIGMMSSCYRYHRYIIAPLLCCLVVGIGWWYTDFVEDFYYEWNFIYGVLVFLLGGCSDGLERELPQKESIYVNRGNSNSNFRCSKLHELFIKRRSPQKKASYGKRTFLWMNFLFLLFASCSLGQYEITLKALPFIQTTIYDVSIRETFNPNKATTTLWH